MNLRAAVDRLALIHSAQARGFTTPQLQQEANSIIAMARSSLTPQEFHSAQQAVTVRTSQLVREAQGREAMHEVKETQHHADKIAKSVTGLDSVQVKQALETGRVAVKGKRALTKADVEASLAPMLKGMEADKMSYKQFTGLIDRVEEIELTRGKHGDHVQKFLEKKFPGHSKEALALVDGFRASGVEQQISMGMDDVPDTMAEVSDDTLRRVEILDAFAQEAKHDKSVAKSLMTGEDDTPAHYLESDEMHGDFARAFEAADKEAEQEDINNYQPESFDVKDEEQTHGII